MIAKLKRTRNTWKVLVALVLVLSHVSVTVSSAPLAQTEQDIQRADMLAIAERYATYTWTGAQSNMTHPNLDGGIVDTPDAMTAEGLANHGWWVYGNNVNVGVPYYWGGTTTVEDDPNDAIPDLYLKTTADRGMHFGEKLALGLPAGDTHIEVEGVDAKDIDGNGTLDTVDGWRANGVDCVGFVNNAWRMGTRFGMSDTKDSSRPIMFSELRAGDILMYEVDHVMLFHEYVNYDPGSGSQPVPGQTSFRVYEATLSDGKVVASEYTIEELIYTFEDWRGISYPSNNVKIQGLPGYYVPRTYLNPIDVTFVIDRSGSMSLAYKLLQAQYAANMFVDLMRPGDKIGVVAFESSASVIYPLQTIGYGEFQKTAAKNAINNLYASGGTSIGAGLQAAYGDMITNGVNPSTGQADPIRIMILLSDGWETSAPYVTDDLLNSIKAANITVHTLGIGSDADQELLTDIASKTGGSYYFASSDGIRSMFNNLWVRVYGERVVRAVSGTVSSGATAEESVLVDSTMGSMTVSLLWPGSDLDLTLVQPDGTIIDPTLAGSDRYITFTSGSTYEFYKIEAPQPGSWTVRIFGKQTSSSTEAYTVLASTRDATILAVDLDKAEYAVGEAIKFTASIQDSFSAAPTGPEYIYGVMMLVTAKDPVQNAYTFELYDDGQHGDGVANDGVYANTFSNTGLEGSYNFNVKVAGENNRDGQPFTREYALSTVLKASTFPTNGILDDFNRADGSIGSNWYGNTAGYNISTNQLLVKSKNANLDIYWNTTSFGPDQEAYFTFSSVNTTSADQDLILKSQYVYGWAYGLIDVQYEANANRVVVWTYDHNQSWVQYGADIPVTFVNGDQFGARTLSNGTLEVYRNGVLIAMRDISAWPYNASGGYIGLWFGNAKDARIEDFGGGTVP